MNGDQRFRVFNKCIHDIGVVISNGQSTNIRSGGFAVLSVNDILYIESICNRRKFFSSGMLEIRDDSGKKLTLEELGGFTDEYTVENEAHYSDDEIVANLKKPAKAFNAWLEKIDDPVELHAIWQRAKELDLPQSRMKAIHVKIPNADLYEP